MYIVPFIRHVKINRDYLSNKLDKLHRIRIMLLSRLCSNDVDNKKNDEDNNDSDNDSNDDDCDNANDNDDNNDTDKDNDNKNYDKDNKGDY